MAKKNKIAGMIEVIEATEAKEKKKVKAPPKPKEASNVEKFQILVDCANKESQLFWSRSCFFIAIHLGLFAFTPKLIGNLTKGSSLTNIIILGIPLIGFILAAAWWYIVKESASMIHYWESKLYSLQSTTFTDFCCEKKSCIGIKSIIYCMTIIFALIWFFIFAAIYITINGCPKNLW